MTGVRLAGRPLLAGAAEGELVVLDMPLSFWGGVDPATGTVIDVHHPQQGIVLAGRILVLPGGRGSSSSGSVLLECVRRRTAPVSILLYQADPILVVGAVVAREIYGRGPSVIETDPHPAVRSGAHVRIDGDGSLEVELG